MKRILSALLVLLSSVVLFAQGAFKDVRQTYLWDVTLSMKGYNGAPNIYKDVVDIMVKDIQSIDNERTEIVVIPFQNTEKCDVWRAYATPAGKKELIGKIRAYKNDNVTNTCISKPLEYVLRDVFSPDKIDIMKLMTDGVDNVDPKRLEDVLSRWCELTRGLDAYGYYILLTNSAVDEKLRLQLRGICNFEEIDASSDLSSIAEIVQVKALFAQGVRINIRDEYNKPKRLEFTQYMGKTAPAGYQIHFRTSPNPYVEIDETVELRPDLSVELHPRWLKSQQQLIEELPIEYPYSDITLEYDATEAMQSGKFAFTRLVDKECPLQLINKPEKTVRIYVE